MLTALADRVGRVALVVVGETVVSSSGEAGKGEPQTAKGYLWGWTFVHSDKWLKIEGKYPKGGSNHTIGKDRIAFVASYEELWYEDVFRNIDVRFYGCNEAQFLYQFVARPYADVKDIQLQLNNVTQWNVKENGDAELMLGDLKRTYHASATQEIEGKTVKVALRYIKTDEGHLGFAPNTYRDDLPLIIACDMVK